MSQEQIIEELNRGAIVTHYVPDHGDENEEFHLKTKEKDISITVRDFRLLKLKEVIQYEDVLDDGSFVYVLNHGSNDD